MQAWHQVAFSFKMGFCDLLYRCDEVLELEEVQFAQVDMDEAFTEHLKVVQASQALIPQLKRVAVAITQRVLAGATVFWCGNGGSAADAQHMAAELVGRFNKERRGIASVALTTDSSVLTSLSNDYGYNVIFSRQVDALCTAKDVLIGLTTSGNSPNVLQAAQVAREKGAYVVGMAGHQGGKLVPLVHECLIVPSTHTPRIQETHILLAHLLCEWIENAFVVQQHAMI